MFKRHTNIDLVDTKRETENHTVNISRITLKVIYTEMFKQEYLSGVAALYNAAVEQRKKKRERERVNINEDGLFEFFPFAR